MSGASHQPHARSIDGAEFTASVLLLGRTMTWISLKQMEHARQAPGRQCMLMICWAVAFLLGSMTGPVGATVHGLVAKCGLSLTSAGLIPLMMGAGRLITAAGSGWISTYWVVGRSWLSDA